MPRDDRRFMDLALHLAARGLGRVAPNPAVGCVIVDDAGHVVGRGWTRPGGRPHAETVALAQAGDRARGAAAYVTLEPCAHHGKTPPCAEALIAAGLARVVVAIEDPDPRVSGRGLALLREAGITVDLGVGAEAARELNAGFLKRVTEGRPLVTLKLATSLDGRIATATGQSQWITGEAARRHGHLLRAQHDAILVGIGTVLADDPMLTCRIPGLESRSPVRVVLDGALSISPQCAVIRTAREVPTWVMTTDAADPGRAAPLEAAGAEVIRLPCARPLDLAQCLQALGARGITRLLVEGGARVATAFLAAKLADRLIWYRAPMVIGGDGRAAIDGLSVRELADAAGFRRLSAQPLGQDMVESYARDG